MKSAKLSKKIIAIALAACMLGGTAATGVGSYIGLSTTVNAAETTSNGFEYDTNDDGTVTITGYSGSDTKLVIPSEIDGKKVTSIGNSAFEYCRELTEIKIPDSVTSIGSYAFDYCYSLTSVKIGNGVTSIGERAFSGTGLTSITIPDSVTSIGENAFSWCMELTSITIGNGVTSIGKWAFYDTGLKSITIPDSVTLIGHSAFYDCDSLASVTIGNGVTSIEEYTFDGCTGLTSVTIGNSVTSIGEYAFSDCSGLTSVTIPDSVISIGEGAFSCCTGLTSVTIPDSVISIGGYAFDGCTGLTSVKIGNGVTSIGEWAFEGCTGLTSVTIPDSVISMGSNVFDETEWYNNQPDGLVYVGKVAYGYKGEMPENTKITLKDGTKVIADSAFYNCTGLTEITIPDSVTSIGSDVFDETAWYNNQPDGLVYVGKVAYGYKGEMPENTKITLKDGTKAIAGSAFYNRTELAEITIPDSVVSIGGGAFAWCWRIKDLTIPDSVVSIGGSAFAYCSGPTSLTIPDSVTSIGDSAFASCDGLISVTIGNGVKSISRSAFKQCYYLTSVTIPDSVTSIGDYAFHGCEKLTSITVPESVTSIGCKALGYRHIYTDIVVLVDDIKLYGIKGSAVEAYAKAYNIPFVETFSNNSTMSKTTINFGDALTITGNTTDGTAPYKYSFLCKHSTETQWTTLTSYGTTSKRVWQPKQTGIYSVRAKIKDATGRESIKDFVLTVNPALANNSTMSKTTINFGDSLTITGKATDGTAPYKYSFLCKHSTETKWTTLTSYGTNSKRVWQPKKTGTYTVRTKVKDATGKEVIKDFTLKVNPALVNNSTMNKTTINFGDALTITGKAANGTSPYKYSFLCKHSTATKWTTLTSYGTTSKRVWKPTKSGTYSVRTKVKDATGKEVVKDFTLTVK